MSYLQIKRGLDVFCATFGLIVFAPVLLFVAILIKLRMQGPIFFVQVRPGLNGKLFKMYKFRTMLTDTSLLEDKRVTKLGHVLRKTSIDELPELFNVLRGEMSIVGPRPLLPEYLPLYSPEQMKRHHVKPGITGWAQVNGRNDLSWERKFELDVWYVENVNFWLDTRIVLKTFSAVLQRKGINHSKEVTMIQFRGSQKDVA